MKTKLKIILVSAALISLGVSLAAQNAYYDALTFTKFDDDKIASIERYLALPGFFTADEKAKIETMIDFLKNPLGYAADPQKGPLPMDILPVIQDKMQRQAKSLRFLPEEIPTFAGQQAASPWFTNKVFQKNLIDALGTLIAERFKADLTTIYLYKFKDKLEKNTFYNNIKILFPATTKLIDQDDIFTYFSLGNQWKTAFQGDLDALPDNLLKYLEAIAAAHPEWIKKSLLPYLELTVDVVVRLLYGYQPVEILTALDIDFSSKKNDPDYRLVYAAIHSLDLFQKNLQRVEQPQGGADNQTISVTWIGFSEFETLLVKPQGLEYFLALIYLQDKEFFAGSELGKLMLDSRSFLEHYLNPCLDILNRIKMLEEKPTGAKGDYLAYMQLTVDLFKDAYRLVAPAEKETPETFEIIQAALDIFQSIYRKDYYGVIADGLFILNKIAEDKPKVAGALEALQPFAVFIEGLASAQDANQMKSVISAVILPSGSFMTNRTAKFSVSISAHPGVFVGAESLAPQDDPLAPGQRRWGSVLGFTAPLGVEFCFGGSGKSGGTSLGIMASLIDLGAVVSYRIPQKQDAYDGLPDAISLKQVFSPGLALHIGFKNSPLTLGMGWQYTPELRKIDKQQNLELEANAHRIFLRLTWAIPFIHIYHSK